MCVIIWECNTSTVTSMTLWCWGRLTPRNVNALDTLKQTCAKLGLPLAPEKLDDPTTIITFLGIVIDKKREELQLPEEKMQRLRQR